MLINEVSRLTGLSKRAIRYYESEGLIHPDVDDNGYRYFNHHDLEVLHHICFMRYLNIPVKEIKSLIQNERDKEVLMSNHLEALKRKRNELDLLITLASNTIKNYKGEIDMTIREKFELFKAKRIQENEAQFGKEAREKYGDDVVNASNEKLMNLSEADFERQQMIEQELLSILKVGTERNLRFEEKSRVRELHKEWLMFSWKEYNIMMHLNLMDMYEHDERFQDYYNQKVDGSADVLIEAVRNTLENE